EHGGREPFYPPRPDGTAPQSLGELRVDTEVLNTEHAAVVGKWFFGPGDGKLLGGEMTIVKEDDPCGIYFGHHPPVDGRQLPHRIDVRYGNEAFGVVTIKGYTIK